MQGPWGVGSGLVGTSNGSLFPVLNAIDNFVGNTLVPVIRYNAMFAGPGTCCNGGETHRRIGDQVIETCIFAVGPCGSHLPESSI